MTPSRLAPALCLCIPLAALPAPRPNDPWTLVSQPPPLLYDLARVDDTLYARTQLGLYTLNPASMTWSPYPGYEPPAPPPLPGDAGRYPTRERYATANSRRTFPGIIEDTALMTLSDSNLFRYQYNGMNWIPWKLANPGVGNLKEIFLHQGALLVSGAGGIARSLDKAKSWMKPAMPDGIPTFDTFCARGDTLYAGAGITIPSPLGGLFRSLDRGATWTRVGTPAAGKPMVQLPASRQGPLVILMTDSLYVSVNGGAAWQERGPSFMRGSGPANQVYFDGRTLLVQRGDAFGVSLDAGASWTERTRPDSLKSMEAESGGMGITDSSLWLILGTKSLPHLYASRDQGLTWNLQSNIPYPRFVRTEGKTLRCLSEFGVHAWSLDEGKTWNGPDERHDILDVIRQGGMIWAGTRDGVFRSQDGGLTWIPDGLDGYDAHLSLRGNGPGQLAATHKGVFARNPSLGEDWRLIIRVNDATAISGEGDLLAGLADSLGDAIKRFYSVDGGKSVVFQTQKSDIRPIVHGNRIWAIDSQMLYQVEVKAGKLVSTPQPLVTEETGYPYDSHDPYAFLTSLLTGNPYFLLGTMDGLYLSSDSGKTWSPSPSPLGKRSIDYLLRMGDRLAVVNHGGVWMSRDNGGSWAMTDTLSGEEWDQRITLKSSEGMAVMPLKSNEFRILSREGRWSQAPFPKGTQLLSGSYFIVIGTTMILRDTVLYRSDDMGSTWTELNATGCVRSDWGVVGKAIFTHGLPGPCPDPFPSLASNPFILSQDAGRTWAPVAPGRFNPPLPDRVVPVQMVDGLALIDANPILYASWNGLDWISRQARLESGRLAPTPTRLYRASPYGLFFLPLSGGSNSIAENRTVPLRPQAGLRFAGSHAEALSSTLYFPAKGRYDLTAMDVRGRCYPVRTGIGADGPGLQSIAWRAPAPGLYILRLSPE